MPYVIKMRSTRGYVSKFYKNKDELKVSYHKHLKEAKVWKTEKGVINALTKFLDKNTDIDVEDFMIIKKKNSELGIYESNNTEIKKEDKKEEVKNDIVVVKEKRVNKIVQFLKTTFKYIKEQIKFYFPE